MRYQLVLQCPAVSEADFDRLISVEELIVNGLGDIGIVDGQDSGSGEMQVFAHTEDPRTWHSKKSKIFFLSGKTCGK
jgi:hypothetical protein